MTQFATFQDFNFKLAVIQVLMYEKNIIEPRFDVWAFAEQYAQRRIDVDDEGYEIIPEVKQYFEELAVPSAALTDIEELFQDGGNDIYMQLCPFWSGEDDIFNIQSAADASLLPNLKSVVLFHDETGDRILQEFRSRGISAKWL